MPWMLAYFILTQILIRIILLQTLLARQTQEQSLSCGKRNLSSPLPSILLDMFSYDRAATSQPAEIWCATLSLPFNSPSDSWIESGGEKKRIPGQSLIVRGAMHMLISRLGPVLRRLFATLLIALFLPNPARAQGRLPLTKHVRDAVAKGQAGFLGWLPATQSLGLTIALPLRNQAQLQELLQSIYDPQSPSYHHFLSVQEFTDQFGPSQPDYDALISFAEANGLTITGTAPNRMIVDVTGTVANIERAFHVTMGVYQHPTENRTFYASDQEPAPDLPFPLWHITGLDNFSIPHPASLTRESAAKSHRTGSGPDGYFIGSDLRAAYYGDGALDGSGQSVGLAEFDGYNLSDVENYFGSLDQPLNVAVVGVAVTHGSSLSCEGGCDDTEQALDIEEVISMAPAMSQVRVYVSDFSDVDIFNRMASDDISKSLSCSWGWDPADPTSDDPIFEEFALQGQNLFVASGDSGAYKKKSIDVFPADDAYVTSVGGTDLITNGAGGAWQSETAWSHSGGGISPDQILIPSYQTAVGVITAANKGSKIYRNSPDVAAEADLNNYICYDGTCAAGWGGTSFAAPQWAGYLALANQQSQSVNSDTLGFINPALYSIGLSPSYDTNFHDIIRGSNGTRSARKGYDLLTGWGSPNQSGLIDSLVP
jgi:subtilase family serine protease